ncbi:hypothetical protein [Achromobacter sp. NFACC18-2]|uniref:hypothetical protein n=1 Tax=Achromobacter sp. NFACC18-2 TaxID=1564112 RepID=UPI0008B79851|nr:hypothetical protein [Achromobacter sp. NFACC18-2]SEJ85585.1 hypothetical protein SAMN03159494_03609 [Achromobacter sp. NFACC18-2]
MQSKISPDPNPSSCAVRHEATKRLLSELSGAYPAYEVDDGTDDESVPWFALTNPQDYALVFNCLPTGLQVETLQRVTLLAQRWEDYSQDAVIAWFDAVAGNAAAHSVPQ